MSGERSLVALPDLSEESRLELREQERFELGHFVRTVAIALGIAAVLVASRLLRSRSGLG